MYPFSAEASFPVLVNPEISQYNGQIFGKQICPVDDYNVNDPNEVLNNRQKYGLVKRIVYCVQGLVIPAAYQIMYYFSVNYIAGTVAAAMTLAVLFWGWLMAVGKNSAPTRDAFVVALKIGGVSFFTFVLGQSYIWPQGLFPVLIQIIDQMSGIVTSYVGYSTTMRCAANYAPTDMWGKVDCAINTLVGSVFNPSLLLSGLLGFFVCAFVSGTIGVFIALVGFSILSTLIFAILRAAYITITAYIAIAVMAIISPIFITCILFSVTRAYFEKWLKLLIGFMLQPIFLFAYLAMMLAAFDTVVYDGPYSIYRAIVPANEIGYYPSPLNSYPFQNQNTNPYGDFMIGNWLYNEGVYKDTSVGSFGVGTNPRLAAKPSGFNVGIGGTMGGNQPPVQSFNRKDAGGIVINILNSFAPIGVYSVSWPIKRISWQDLALLHLCSAPNCTAITQRATYEVNICGYSGCTAAEQEQLDETLHNITLDYLINLLLALLMAFLTMYVFGLMLDFLPFIGAGIGGEQSAKMPFGAGKLSPPGNSILGQVKASVGGAGP
ncbi:MAG: type IV secretion system protein [Alphaproteobacteria bacterium]|nr:type IV secretion system protein [Alphaproteobacteria bacterium]